MLFLLQIKIKFMVHLRKWFAYLLAKRISLLGVLCMVHMNGRNGRTLVKQ